MNINNMKSGICPECGNTEIYTDSSLPKRGERTTIPINSIKWFFTDCCVCLNCGCFEEFVVSEDLKDEKKIAMVRETWKRVSPHS